MNNAELKLQIFRLIDNQEDNTLHEIYNALKEMLYKKRRESEDASELEYGYQAMSMDKEREAEALEWIEGTINDEEI